MMYNDQVIARLGHHLNAPVADTALVEISQELINLNSDPNSQMGHLIPCVAHASKLIENVSDRVDTFDHITEGDNKTRFCSCAILHAWMHFSDRQFIYESVKPFRVFTVDHGHFFPSGPDWTIESLKTAPPPAIAADIVTACSLSETDISAACQPLASLDERDLARALSIPPESWGVSLSDRVALAAYLWARRSTLLNAHTSVLGAAQ